MDSLHLLDNYLYKRFRFNIDCMQVKWCYPLNTKDIDTLDYFSAESGTNSYYIILPRLLSGKTNKKSLFGYHQACVYVLSWNPSKILCEINTGKHNTYIYIYTYLSNAIREQNHMHSGLYSISVDTIGFRML